MVAPRCFALVALVALAASCASPGDTAARRTRADVPAPGWIDFTLQDRKIPADPLAAGEPRPPTCWLEVSLNGEAVIAEDLHPTGSAPPYALESNFRVAAPAGQHTAVIYYSSCRIFETNLDSMEAEISLAVAPGGVTQVRFDGAMVFTKGPE